MKTKFKDQCDICNQFKYLKGYNNYCICEDCEKILRIHLQPQIFGTYNGNIDCARKLWDLMNEKGFDFEWCVYDIKNHTSTLLKSKDQLEQLKLF